MAGAGARLARHTGRCNVHHVCEARLHTPLIGFSLSSNRDVWGVAFVLGRFKRFLWQGDDHRAAISPDPQAGAVSVTCDHTSITVHQADGRSGSLNWDDIGSVTVAITANEMSDDVFWLLLSRDRARFLAVPLCAVGERELLLAMQIRLRGFDNDAVIEAMTSTATEHYVVWEAPALQ